MGRLDGRVAVITGGARGLGAAYVRRFVEEGARVVAGDVLEADGAALARELGAAVRFVPMDVTDEAAWSRAVATATGEFGRLDVLVNNAGILRVGKIADMAPADFRRVIDVNLFGTWLGVRAVIAPMAGTGGGSIVNVSSIEGLVGGAGLAAYSASKFGVRGVTRSAARELAPLGIRVNSVHPGPAETPMLHDPQVAGLDIDALLATLPMRRVADPVEVAEVVLFLASDAAGYCTGSEFVVDGGALSGTGL